jgi:hypothetical protein
VIDPPEEQGLIRIEPIPSREAEIAAAVAGDLRAAFFAAETALLALGETRSKHSRVPSGTPTGWFGPWRCGSAAEPSP